MKINCQSCGAKYTIADDKVRGRTVKIRCKKCGSAIVVSGSEVPTTARGGEEEQETKIFETAPPPEGAATDGQGEWTINVAEGDQRNGTTDEIIALLASGVITGDTYVWRDGMADWAPLSEVPELLDRIQGPRAGQSASAPKEQQGVEPAPQPAAAPAAKAKLSQPPAVASSTPAPDSGEAGPLASAGPSTAPKPMARRAEARGRDQDLFGGASAAGSEAESPGSQPPGGMFPKDKFTAERNENSVLFSLDALRAPKAKSGPPPAAFSEHVPPSSGIVDIKQLASTAPPAMDNSNNRFDDIMNMGNAGLMTATLAAPVLPTTIEPEPAPVQVASADLGEVPTRKSNTKFIVIAAAAVVVISVGGFLAFGRGQAPASEAKLSTPSATAPAETTKPADSPTAAVSVAAVASADTPTSAGGTSTKTDERKDPTPTVRGPLVGAGQSKDTAKAAETAKAEATAAAAPAETKPAEKPAEAPPAAEFNRNAAVSALNAAAGGASGCKKADGPTGTGRVSVTFAPSGRVTTATVEGPPFAGTSVGGCVAARFRGASVPPFTGSPVTVHKSFTIN